MPRVRRLAHEALGGEIVAGGAALDDVRRDGERCAREADERDVRGQRALHQPHGFEHEADRARDVHGGQARDVGLAAHGTVDHRPLALGELEPHAERLDDQQDIGEEDRRVDAEPLDRLQRDLGRRLRRLGELEERVTRAQRAVLRQVASGLAHEPHRGEGRRPAARGEQQRRVGHEPSIAGARAGINPRRGL